VWHARTDHILLFNFFFQCVWWTFNLHRLGIYGAPINERHSQMCWPHFRTCCWLLRRYIRKRALSLFKKALSRYIKVLSPPTNVVSIGSERYSHICWPPLWTCCWLLHWYIRKRALSLCTKVLSPRTKVLSVSSAGYSQICWPHRVATCAGISAKEPYLSAQKSCLLTLSLCTRAVSPVSLNKSRVSLHKSPMYL